MIFTHYLSFFSSVASCVFFDPDLSHLRDTCVILCSDPVSRRQVTGQVDGKKALLAMIALDEIRGRLAEAPGLVRRRDDMGLSENRVLGIVYQKPFTIVYHFCH